MKKTDAPVTVPVMDLVHKVAARHDGELPQIGALTRFNKLLRKGGFHSLRQLRSDHRQEKSMPGSIKHSTPLDMIIAPTCSGGS